MKILSIQVSNLLSLGSVSLSFKDHGLTLVDGWDYDKDSANGAGKSAIFNSLAFSLYGKTPRKITASQILRRGAKKGFALTTLRKDKHVWSVERHKPNKVVYTKDGVVQDITQAEFETEIGLSYSQFLITMYAAQTDGSKLISLNDSAKKDFFLQLMNLEEFLGYKKGVDLEIKDLKTQVIDLERVLEGVSSKINTYREYICDVEDLRSQIDSIAIQLKTDELNRLLLIKEPDLDRFTAVEQKANNKLSVINATLLECALLQNQIKNAERLPAHVICPSCNTDIIPSSHITFQQHMDKQEAEIKELQSKINLYGPKNLLEEKTKLSTLIESLKLRVSSEMKAFTEASRSSQILSQEISRDQNRIRSLETKICQSIETQAKIEKCTELLNTTTVVLDAKAKELELLETVASIFSPTGAPAYIMDSVVDVFNSKMSDYVSVLWPNASYSLQTFKENKDKEIKAKFSEQLVVNGEITSIGGLSGGEYRCMSLAMDFAVVDVLESMFSIQVNPIILDEPFEALDASNRERAGELLERISAKRQIIVVDHASESKAMFTDIVKVEKRDGISRIV